MGETFERIQLNLEKYRKLVKEYEEKEYDFMDRKPLPLDDSDIEMFKIFDKITIDKYVKKVDVKSFIYTVFDGDIDTIPLNKRFYGSVRVSTSKQKEKGSIFAQIDEIKKYVSSTGGTLILIAIDAGLSAKNDFRLGFHIIKSKLRRGNTLIGVFQDRIFRNDSMFLTLMDELYEKGIFIHIIDSELNSKNNEDREIMKLQALTDHMERENIKEDIKIITNDLKNQGIAVTKAPYGYMRDNNLMVKDPVEYKNIEIMMNLRKSDEKMTWKDLANKINDMGIKTKTGKLWRGNQVKIILVREGYKILTNQTVNKKPKYIGINKSDSDDE